MLYYNSLQGFKENFINSFFAKMAWPSTRQSYNAYTTVHYKGGPLPPLFTVSHPPSKKKTRKTVFDHFSKHRKENPEYDM